MATRIQPLAYWSRWKAAVWAIAAAALAIVPNIPGFGRPLSDTAFFSTPFGVAIRIFAALFFGCAALALASLAIASNLNHLAVWIEGDDLFWRGITVRKLPLASIKSVKLTANGVIRIVRTDGKPAAIAASLIRSRSDVENIFKALEASVTP